MQWIMGCEGLKFMTHGGAVGSTLNCLNCRNCDRHGLCSKPTHVILFCPYATFSCLVLWASGFKFQSCLCKTKKQKKKFQTDSNILAFWEASRGKCFFMYSASGAFLRVKKINIEKKLNDMKGC